MLREVRDLRRALGLEMRRLREDVGVSQARLGMAASVSQGYVSAIEAGESAAGLAVLVRLVRPLGGRLRVRIESGAGPLVRDHLQAAMLEALLGAIHPRWARFAEVSVDRPARGSIDLVLAERESNLLVATEIHSQVRRLEAQLRWAEEKARGLSNRIDLAPHGPLEPPAISRLLVLRSTASTRRMAKTYGHVLGTAYPASTHDVLHALLGDAAWPGPGIIWMNVDRGKVRLIERARPRA